ncbi:MAG: outer membrane protein transport protein [Anaerolineales bacterium]|nr:outer membrane protein transport protein [Anaerolineales bacterium]
MRLWSQCLAAAALFTALLATSTWAAGLWLYEQATPDLGTAAAGRAAAAKDASTAGTNPAGMTRLDQSQVLAGFQGLIVDVEFDTDSSGFDGGDGGNAGDFVPAAGLHYVHNLTSDLKLGVTTGSFFGLGLDYDSDWAGRYYVQKAEFLTLGINPGVGYRVNKWLSVGAGFSVIYAELEQKAAINNQVTDGAGTPDGQIKVKDDDIGYGWNLGVLAELREGTRFGVTYRSEVDFNFKDVAKLKGVATNLQNLLDAIGVTGSKVDLEMTIPQAVMVSGYHEFTEKLAVMANFGWQDWSEFGKTSVSVQSQGTTDFTQDRNFKDTWHVAIGAQYRFAEVWLYSLGFAYDSSPVDDKDRTPDMPLDRQLRFGTGLQYDWNKDITVGVAYEYLDAGDAEINQQGGPLQGSLEGDYKTNEIHFFNATLIWRF